MGRLGFNKSSKSKSKSKSSSGHHSHSSSGYGTDRVPWVAIDPIVQIEEVEKEYMLKNGTLPNVDVEFHQLVMDMLKVNRLKVASCRYGRTSCESYQMQWDWPEEPANFNEILDKKADYFIKNDKEGYFMLDDNFREKVYQQVKPMLYRMNSNRKSWTVENTNQTDAKFNDGIIRGYIQQGSKNKPLYDHRVKIWECLHGKLRGALLKFDSDRDGLTPQESYRLELEAAMVKKLRYLWDNIHNKTVGRTIGSQEREEVGSKTPEKLQVELDTYTKTHMTNIALMEKRVEIERKYKEETLSGGKRKTKRTKRSKRSTRTKRSKKSTRKRKTRKNRRR